MRGKFQFSLADLLWAVTLTSISLSLFGLWGLAVAAALLAGVVFAQKARSPAATARRVALVVAVDCCAFVALYPVYDTSGLARRARCMRNLNQIGLLLEQHANGAGKLPPVFETDAESGPRRSWRLFLLPSMRYGPLYAAYDPKEPWNGPNNSKLIPEMPSEYACPEDAKARERGTTSYAVVVGP
ncbi:MAG: DUF1559 domain-containing protein, partial [Thermoguttaceae bacterium]